MKAVTWQAPRKISVEEVPDPLEVQVPIIREVLAALGIAAVGAPEAEADDVIGTLATGAGQPVDVVTGDRDLFQLVHDGASGEGSADEVRVLYIARGVGNHERVTEEWVREKYAVEASQYADFATSTPSSTRSGARRSARRRATRCSSPASSPSPPRSSPCDARSTCRAPASRSRPSRLTRPGWRRSPPSTTSRARWSDSPPCWRGSPDGLPEDSSHPVGRAGARSAP